MDAIKHEILQIVYRNDIESLVSMRKNISKSNVYDFFPINRHAEKFQGITLLHIAAYFNSLECFLYLLYNERMSIDVVDSIGRKPINFAALGASTDVFSFILNYYSANNRLQDFFSSNLDISPPSVMNICYQACHGGSAEILQCLEHSGFDFTTFAKKCKPIYNSCIDASIKRNKAEALKFMLNFSATHSIFEQEEKTPIMIAIINRYFDAIPLLIDVCDVNHITSDYKNALYYACFYRVKDVVKFLLQHMKTIDIPANIKAKAAVHWICMCKDLEIAQLVLERGIDVNRVDEHDLIGPSDLVIADKKDEIICLDILKLLIKHGLKVNFHVQGQSSLLEMFLVNLNPSHLIVDYLLSIGADANQPLTNKQSETIRECMKKNRSKQIQQLYIKYFGN